MEPSGEMFVSADQSPVDDCYFDTITYVVRAQISDLTRYLFDPDSCPYRGDIERIEFESPSIVPRPRTDTFSDLLFLRSICIPASVEVIESFCFAQSPDSIESVPICFIQCITFESGSKLREIQEFYTIGTDQYRN
jgi:hypothetical protein